VIAGERAAGEPVFLVSAGNFYGTPDVFNEPKSHFLSRMMSHLGYDAVAVGNMELGYGIDVLVADVRDYGLNVTCANIMTRGDREPVAADNDRGRQGLKAARKHGTVFPPYLIVEKNGVRFGFMALLSPSTMVRKARTTRNEGAENVLEAISWAIHDPAEAAAKIIPELSDYCDVLVLLAHMDASDIGRLVATFPQIDIVVAGHDLRSSGTADPGKVVQAWMLKATSRGQNVGAARFEVDDAGNIVNLKNRIHFLDEKYDDDPEMVKLVEEFGQENRKQQKILYAKQQLKSSGGQGAINASYLGVGTCQKCHAEAFEVYAESAHAQAYRTLASEFVHRDSNCVGCHVTGYQQAGGFSGLRMRGAQVDLIDVQCEACHGPGAGHTRDGSYVSVAIESCGKCHTENEDPTFDFDTAWEKIKH